MPSIKPGQDVQPLSAFRSNAPLKIVWSPMRFLERGVRRLRPAFLLALLAGISCQRDEPPPVPDGARSAPADTLQVDSPTDSLTRVLLRLERQVAPVMASIERARAEFRADSATVKADSAYVEFAKALERTVREAVRGLDAPAFEALVRPAGMLATPLRIERPAMEEPTDGDKAMADSVVSFLTARGIWLRRSEGSLYLTANEAVLSERLGPYLTPAMQEFLRARVREQVAPVADDAALIIPVSEVAARALWAERFLERHPGSVVHDVVASRFDWYLAIYVGGLPNSDPFDWRTGVLWPALRSSFETVASEHGDTSVGRVVAEYLALLQAADFTRTSETDAFVRELWERVRRVPFP